MDFITKRNMEMQFGKIGLYGILVVGIYGASGISSAQVFSDAVANCNEWWSFNTNENDPSNQEYFNNVFGQYYSYPLEKPEEALEWPYPKYTDLLPTKQCIWLKDNIPVGWSYDWPEIEGNSRRYAVKAFPEIIYGVKGESDSSANKNSNVDSGFPIKALEVLSDKKQVDVEFSYSEYLETEVARNVAIEAFFHEVDGDCSKIDVNNRALEIMIWTERPSVEFTITPNQYAQGISIDGYNWNVYSRKTPQDYIVFEASPTFSGRDIVSSTVNSNSSAQGAYNWNEFVKYVYDNQFGLNVNFDPDYCMAGLEFGTEIWFGKGEFRVDNYIVSVSEGDADNDGVFAKEDTCPATADLMEVSLGSCSTNVANVVQSNGCSVVDELAACDRGSFKNAGQYKNCISGITNNLMTMGLLTGREKSMIQSCAAKVN